MPTAGDQLRSPTHGWTDTVYEHWAEAEEDALIDHLFEHANTPAFVAHALLQRLTSSNPSPVYVKRVADAFRCVVDGCEKPVVMVVTMVLMMMQWFAQVHCFQCLSKIGLLDG